MCSPSTSLSSLQQTPEDFATILGHCLTDLAAGRATIEDCLQRYPAQSGRLSAILPFAERAQVNSSCDQSSTIILPISSLIT